MNTITMTIINPLKEYWPSEGSNHLPPVLKSGTDSYGGLTVKANSLPSDNFFTKFKASADNKLSVANIIISVLDRVENIVGKGKNAGYQHFPLFPQSFPKASLSRSLKTRDYVVKSEDHENLQNHLILSY